MGSRSLRISVGQPAYVLAQRSYAAPHGIAMVLFHILVDVIGGHRVLERSAVGQVLLKFTVLGVTEDAESASDRVPSAVCNVRVRVVPAVRTAVPACKPPTIARERAPTNAGASEPDAPADAGAASDLLSGRKVRESSIC